uniref:Metal-nicotianamine transporter YSL7 n=1 Tax=Chenopodium quinoa TaxID=63459 RepID=A0A803MDC4_CHEQI
MATDEEENKPTSSLEIDNSATDRALIASVEKTFEGTEVPSWKQQLTIRAFVVSFVLSILFTFIVMKLNLTTGIIPSLNVSAGLLGFFFVKTWTKLLEKSGYLKQPFTRQENTVIQTCVVASSGIAFSGGAGSYVLGMSKRVAELGDKAFLLDIKNPSLGWMTGFLFVVSFIGLFSVVPLRKEEGEDVRQILHFQLLLELLPMVLCRRFYFDFSATYVGVGMICPYLINISILLGAILSWGVMWPLIAKQKGHWYAADAGDSNLHGLQGYRVFIAIAIILGDGLYNFVKVFGRSVIALYKEYKKKQSGAIIPYSARPTPEVSPESFDDQRRTQYFLQDRIPNWAAAAGYVAIAAIAIGVLPQIIHQLNWYHVLVLYIVAPVLAFCNAYGCGLTDWSLASTYGKLAIFIIGGWAGASHGGIVAGLAACGVMMNIVSTASDLTQDFKTGYMTLASPRSMFVSQIVGTAMGCVISPIVFWIFYNAYPDLGLPESKYPAPFAAVYRNIALLGVEGVSTLPKNCLLLCIIFFIVAMGINGVKDVVGEKYSRFIPIPMAMAIPFYLGGYFAIDMCVGSLILFVWEYRNKAKADAFAPAVASGLICGDGIWSLPSAILALAGVNPPICMKFVKS